MIVQWLGSSSPPLSSSEANSICSCSNCSKENAELGESASVGWSSLAPPAGVATSVLGALGELSGVPVGVASAGRLLKKA